jgi:hypothetical protein
MHLNDTDEVFLTSLVVEWHSFTFLNVALDIQWFGQMAAIES